MNLLYTASRQLLRNRRRNVINIAALALGMTIMITCIGWVRGYFTGLYDSIISLETGHLQLLPEGYLEQQRRFPLDMTLKEYDSLKRQVQELPETAASTGRIDFTARIGDGRRSIHVLGRAVDPPLEREVTTLHEKISLGTWLDASGPGILIGRKLAEAFNVVPGDSLYLAAADRYGAQNFTEVVVSGIFSIGFGDDSLVITNLEHAMEMLRLENEVTRLVVWLAGGVSLGEGKEELIQYGNVYPWQQFAGTLVSAVQADLYGFIFMVVLMFLLIVLGLMNSVFMNVQERQREIGTLRALGMKKRDVTRLLLLETAVLASAACIVSGVLSGSAALYLGNIGFDLAQFIPEGIPIPIEQRFTADYRWYDFLLTMAAGLLLSLGASYPAAKRAASVPIARALGFVVQ